MLCTLDGPGTVSSSPYGFVNRNTADVWESGPHFHAANITIPSMMLAVVTVVALAVTSAVQGRSRKPAVSTAR